MADYYTKTGPFTNGSAPPIDATFLNALETALDTIAKSATTTTEGVVELATTAEATAGSDNARAVTPLGLQTVRDILEDVDAAMAADIAALEANQPVPFQFARLSADFTGPTNTTMTDVTGLKFTIGTSSTEVWAFEFHISVDVATAIDFNVALTGPSGAVPFYTAAGPGTTVTADGGTPYKTLHRATFGQNMGFGGIAGTPQPTTIRGIIRGGGTAGDIQLQVAQNTSGATAPVVKIDSNMSAARVVA